MVPRPKVCAGGRRRWRARGGGGPRSAQREDAGPGHPAEDPGHSRHRRHRWLGGPRGTDRPDRGCCRLCHLASLQPGRGSGEIPGRGWSRCGDRRRVQRPYRRHALRTRGHPVFLRGASHVGHRDRVYHGSGHHANDCRRGVGVADWRVPTPGIQRANPLRRSRPRHRPHRGALPQRAGQARQLSSPPRPSTGLCPPTRRWSTRRRADLSRAQVVRDRSIRHQRSPCR